MGEDGMTMTNEEICRDYRQAAAPSKQIRILSELNECDRETIKQILVDGGCKLPGNCGVKSRTKSQETPTKPQETEKLPGAKSDAGKLDLTQVPPEIIKAIAAIRDYGNRKYSDPDNWRRVEPQKFHAALIRHAVAMWEDPWAVDPESGYPHLWHLCCNAAFLCAMKPKGDDDND